MNDLNKLIRQFEGADYFDSEPEPKVSGLWLMTMGIGTFAAAVLIGAYFVMEAIAGV